MIQDQFETVDKKGYTDTVATIHKKDGVLTERVKGKSKEALWFW